MNSTKMNSTSQTLSKVMAGLPCQFTTQVGALAVPLAGVFLVFSSSAADAHQNVFSRSDAGTNLWENGTNKPWFYQVYNNTENRPDIFPLGTRNDVFFGHNNNLTQDVNSLTRYDLRSLTMQSGASSARTFNSSGGAGISLSSAFTNESGSGAHVFNTQIGVDGSTVAFSNSGSKVTFSGSNFYVNGNTAAFSGNGDFDISAVMSGGGGSVTKSGNGTLTLLTNNKTYTGTTSVSGGKITTAVTLDTSAVNVTGGEFETTADNRLADTATLSISSGLLDIQGTDTVASLTSTGGAVTITAGKILSVTANSSIGAGSTITGGTLAATGGTLTFNSASGNSSAVTIASGATLAGTGMIGGTLGISGNLAPGAAGVDIQTLDAGTTTWNGGSNLWNFDLSASAGSSDALIINGDFTKGTGGAYKFDFMGSAPAAYGNAYTLVTWNGTTNFNAGDFSFQNLAGSFTAVNNNFAIVGKSLVFTAVPEPTSALAGLLFVAGLLRRRRA